jgi:hypothetical protein
MGGLFSVQPQQETFLRVLRQQNRYSREFNKMPANHPRPSVLRNAFTLTALAGLSALAAHAQQAVPAAAGSSDSSLIASVNTRPMDLAQFAGVDYSSSTTSVDLPNSALPADPGSLNLAATGEGMQPPPRRRYGRPRYNDNSHNADGSNKYTFVAAAGFELPTGNTYHYFNTNFSFQVGGGRQFNKKFAVLAQFDWDEFGVNGATLDNQYTVYNYGCPSGSVAAGTCGVPLVDGNNHVWSFTLNPKYTFYEGDKYGAYVIGGVGFYHKVTNFTTPEQETVDYYGFLETVDANATFDHYTSNAPGFNAGFGLTYKFSRFADERFFIEGRYVFVDNSNRTGYTASNVATTNYSGYDYFPANANKTTYIPIKVGIRF